MRFHPVGFIPLAGIGAGIIGATVLTPLLAVPILSVAGFSAAGPVAGKKQFPPRATVSISNLLPSIFASLLDRFARSRASSWDRKRSRRKFIRRRTSNSHGSWYSNSRPGHRRNCYGSRGSRSRRHRLNRTSNRRTFFLRLPIPTVCLLPVKIRD